MFCRNCSRLACFPFLSPPRFLIFRLPSWLSRREARAHDGFHPFVLGCCWIGSLSVNFVEHVCFATHQQKVKDESLVRLKMADLAFHVASLCELFPKKRNLHMQVITLHLCTGPLYTCMWLKMFNRRGKPQVLFSFFWKPLPRLPYFLPVWGPSRNGIGCSFGLFSF